MRFSYSFFSYLVDTLFPRVCLGCRKKRTLLCEQCLSSIPRADVSVHSFVTSLFDYRHPLLRTAIWKFKYKNARGLAKQFGASLYEEIIGDLGEELAPCAHTTFLLIPIPLHRKRKGQRGYNQSELLVKEILKNDTLGLFTYSPKALIRTRDTKSQARSQKRSLRLENLNGAFSASGVCVRGKHILLIDDVTTTGATLVEARKALRAQGAETVKAYTVAH